jgi:hypothetical protein
LVVEHVPSSCLVVYKATAVSNSALAHRRADWTTSTVFCTAAISWADYWVLADPRTFVCNDAVACILRSRLGGSVREISKIWWYIVPRRRWGAICAR